MYPMLQTPVEDGAGLDLEYCLRGRESFLGTTLCWGHSGRGRGSRFLSRDAFCTLFPVASPLALLSFSSLVPPPFSGIDLFEIRS